MMKVIVDRDTCIGCELCVSVCPKIFAMDGTGKAKVILEAMPKEFEACAEEAKKQCSVSAITVE